jgi:hypothetical protein
MCAAVRGPQDDPVAGDHGILIIEYGDFRERPAGR